MKSVKNRTTIEVNGKRYDANTGAVIGVATAPVVKTGQNIDGFFRSRTVPRAVPSLPLAVEPSVEKITVLAAPAPAHHIPAPHAQPSRAINHARAHAPQSAVAARPERPAAVQPVHKLTVQHAPAAPNHTKAHAVQSAQTLRRDAVQRPAPSFHKQAGTVASLQHAVPSLIVPKQSLVSIDAERLARAQAAARSSQISHHGEHHAVQPSFVELAVQPMPGTPTPTPTAKPGSDDPAGAPSPIPTNKPTDIFEQALANATNFVDIHAHKHHFKRQARRHMASMAAGTLALIVIAGFAAYQNTPGLKFRVASIQAGVSTNMPNFQAAGFAYNGVRTGNGKLTIGFSNSHATYQLTQQTTNLSDNDMIQTIGATDASGAPNYKTVTAGGTTVYRFDNTNATWVSGGKWYTVSGNGALSDQQVESLVKNV